MEPTTPNAQLDGGFRCAALTLPLGRSIERPYCSVATPATTKIRCHRSGNATSADSPSGLLRVSDFTGLKTATPKHSFEDTLSHL